MTWDGIERRVTQRDGMDGRRIGDYHCPDHNVIQESTKEHRQIVCGKIKSVKADAERDIAEVKLELENKADSKDLRGMVRLISILISIAVLVIAGQAMWLRSDISDVGAKIQRLNQRVTEGVDERVRSDMEQTKQLDTIAGELKVVSWRLGQLEESKKVNK